MILVRSAWVLLQIVQNVTPITISMFMIITNVNNVILTMEDLFKTKSIVKNVIAPVKLVIVLLNLVVFLALTVYISKNTRIRITLQLSKGNVNHVMKI